jgi:hypothetical protein
LARCLETAAVTELSLVAGAVAAAAILIAGFFLHRHYRAAIDYKGIGRPYPIGNSVLAFAGITMMILGAAAAGVLLMLLLA